MRVTLDLYVLQILTKKALYFLVLILSPNSKFLFVIHA